MDLFTKAKTVRLRSHHDKYLVAEEDQEGVSQDRNGSSRQAKWAVELIDGSNAIRLKSCYGRYLTASNVPFLLGMTGRKALQSIPRRLDSSVEWEPIREGVEVRLRTRYGQYLRANGGPPPWRNSVTHDVPHRTAHQDWVLWDVDVVEVRPASPERKPIRPASPERRPARRASPERRPVRPASPERRPLRPASPERRPIHQVSSSSPSVYSSAASASSSRPESFDDGSSSPPTSVPAPVPAPVLTKQESLDYIPDSIRKPDGRMIQYRVADDRGDVDEDSEPSSFMFHGSTVEQLTERLKEETELDDIIVCTHSLLNGKLYPLRLHLPPNNAALNVVVVPSTSKGTLSFISAS